MNVTLCLTHDCNLRCTYCYAGRKQDKRMAWATAKRAIDFSFEHAINHARLTGRGPAAQLGYFGGEPLLEWELLKRSSAYADEAAARLGLELKKTVTTNMTLLDAARIGWLRENAFYVGLSLDGNAAMHDTLRHFPDGSGSHAACIKMLGHFAGPDAPAEVIVVVDPRNVAHLVDSVEWLMAQDIRSIALNPNFYVDWPEAALEVWREAYAQIGRLFIDAYRRQAPVRINVFDGKIKVRIKEGYAACDMCGFGLDEVAVAASGNLYPCERIVSDDTHAALCLGNVFDGFDEVKRRKIVACRGNIVEECRECPLQARCMNWCGCINYATTGAVNEVAGIVCFHEKLAIQAADEAASILYAERNPGFLAKFYGVRTCW